MVNIGDKVVITKLSGSVLEAPHIATVVEVGETWFEFEEEIKGENIVLKYNKVDEWSLVEEEANEEKGRKPLTTPKVGQLVRVDCQGQTKYGEVVGTDVSDAGEYEFMVNSGDSSKIYKLNQVDSVETYKGDEDKIMPNYLQLASQGMTFSEFAGEKITAKSLNFRPYDDKVNHPNHYNKYSREVIESIKGLCTPDEFRGYLKGNIIKYSARYSDKDGIQDIDKLAKYTQFLKEFELEMIELNEEE